MENVIDMSLIEEKMTDKEKVIYSKYQDSFPLRIVEFINDLGIEVIASEMKNDISGVICKENDKFYILINDLHPLTRIRFTLAHELGHYFNDRDYLDSNKEIVDPIKQNSQTLLYRTNIPNNDYNMRRMDIAANQFAANILMPELKFLEIWRENYHPENVAKFFGVSIEAVKIRAATLLGEIF